MLDELRDRLQGRKDQEALVEAAKTVVPPPEVLPAAVPEATPMGKSKEKEPESRAASSKSSSQKSRKKKEKISIPKLEDEEESTVEDSPKSEEEDEPSTPPLDLKPRMSVNTRSTGKKQPPPIYRNPYIYKRQSKTPGKGEGSNKKPREK